MAAFLGAIGIVGILVGLVLMVLGRIKKKKFKGGLIALISLGVFIVAVITTQSSVEKSKSEKASTNVASDETDNYKVTNGKITNNSLLINLAVRAESIIEKYDKIDNVKVKEENIKAVKLSDLKNDEREEVYKNVYSIIGEYSWQDKRYAFEWVISFDENNVDSNGSVLQYSSDIGGSQINETSPSMWKP